MANKLNIQDTPITITQINDEDYISLTDMMKVKEGDFFFHNWLRNRNTVEFLGIWEKVHNPNFNSVEFDIIKSQAGLHNFRLSAKEWMEKTGAIGIVAKTGRYGGTYAHKDIAFEFAMWISPEFKVFLIKDYQQLKETEQKALGWSAKRELAKINYHIHTDAIKANLVPQEIDPYHRSLEADFERFPEDFMFQLNKEEFENWKSHFAISNSDSSRSQIASIKTEGDVLSSQNVILEMGTNMSSQSCRGLSVRLVR